MKRIILPVLALLISQFSDAQICTKAQLPTNLKDGLVGYYPFCGNANDESGNGVNGVVSGATLTADRFGNTNSAYNFNGTNNYITIANVASNTFTSTFSISVWIKPAAGYGSGSSPNGNQNQVVSKWGYGGVNNAAYSLGVDQSGYAFTGVHNGSVSSSAYSTPTTLAINNWHHLVSTLSGGILKLYVNNVLVKTITNSVNSQNSRYTLDIAREALGNYGYFKGVIDDIQIYNRALTACEVTQIYTSTSTGFTTPAILTFNPLPTQSSLCGSLMTLNAGAGFTSYLWNTGATSQTITATTSGEYRVTVTNASGCNASDTINVSIVKADILQSDQTICSNTPFTLSVNSYASQSAKTIDFDNVGIAALDVTGGTASLITGLSGNGLSISRPTEVRTKDQTYTYGDYEVDAKTGTNTSNQYLSVLLPLNSWTNEAISIDSRPAGTDDVGWGVYVNGVRVAFATGSHPASASSWYKMKIRVTPDSVKCWINSTLLYQGLNTTVPRNIGAVKLSTFSTSHFDNLKYTPYQTFSSVLWSTSATTSTISVTPQTTTTYFATISDGISSCTDSVTLTVANIVGYNPLQDTIKVCGDSTVIDAGAGFETYAWSNGARTRVISPKVSGKYIVTVTNAGGCTASDTSYLSIVKARIIQRDTTICKGSSIRLSIDSLFPRVVNTIHQNAFQSASNLWTNLRLLNYNSQSVAGNYMNDSLQFIASNLPVHDSVFVSADLYLFDSWDGNCGGIQGPDYWGINVNGGGLFRTTFSNYPFGSQTCSNVQAYPGSVGSSNAWGTSADLRNLPAIMWNEAISTKYNFSKALNHSSSNLILSFFGNNLQADESWGIDNVNISTIMNRPQVTWSTGATSNSITVSPTTTTKYFITVTDGITTCRDSITVSVSDIGSFNPLQDTVKVCGDSSILDAGAGFATYNWSNGATTRTITAKASGKYFVTVANASGCSASDTSVVSIVKAKMMQRDTVICKGASIKLSIDSSFSGNTACYKTDLPNSLQNGIVAYFPFCGNANDVSGNGNNGNVNGARLTRDRFNNDLSAYSFSSISDNSITGNLNTPLGQTFSISFWAKRNTNNIPGPSIQSDKEWMFSSGNSSVGGATNIGITNNSRSLRYGPWGTDGNDATYLVDNSWQHIVQTYSNGQFKIYVNGKFYKTSTDAVNLQSGAFSIGCQLTPFLQQGFDGSIDDVIIYNKDLTDIDITLLYNAGSRPTALWSTGATTSSITVNPTVKTTYKVTVTDGITTCTDSIVVDVSSSELKVTDPAAVCSPEVVNLTASAITSGSATGLTYTYWKDANATQALVNPDKVSVSGTFYIVGTSSTGCTSAPTAVKVTVNPLPTATIIAPTQTTICDKSSITLTARGGTSYQWLLNGSAIVSASDSTYAASQAGSYEVNAIALGCTSKVAAPVNLTLIKAAIPKFSNSSTCIEVPVSFFNETDTTASGSVNYVWDFGDEQTSTLFNPVYTYKKSGAFVVKLTVTPKLCSSLLASITKNITVDVPPVGIKYPNVLAVKNKPTPLSARFIINGYTYLWMPSTGLNNGAIQKPIFNGSNEQLYRVRLTSPNGCITMDTVKVSVYDSSDIFVPKAFSPNKDGKNDLLQPFLVNIVTLKFFRVYNRWGQLMFQSSDSRQGWDGMYNFKPQPLETYTWIAEGIDGNGITIFRKGQTVLIR
jgi:gliding motility-associated-like protein